MASDALKFGDAMRGPSASVAEGEHWATIVRRVAVRSPRWAFPPRLPGGRTAGRRALFRDSNSLADSRRGVPLRRRRSRTRRHFRAPDVRSRLAGPPLRRGSSCNQPAPPRLTPLQDSLPAHLESGFPGGIVAGRLPRIRSIPWPPVRTGKAFCAFRW